ncbi:hypothetical protein KUCAC02_037222 [Chaenocephalus aceratus]|nr:hypothetical protein KUCAC02_037222 [Chaenocephalus aceratus]
MFFPSRSPDVGCPIRYNCGLVSQVLHPHLGARQAVHRLPGRNPHADGAADDLPLLLTNLITGASGFKAHRVIAGRAAAYFLSTTLMSLSVGIFLVMMFEPGSSPSVEGEDPGDIEPFFNMDSLMDIRRNMAPKRLIQASFRQYETDRIGKVLVDVFQALNEATKIIVGMILNFLPVGVLFLTTCYRV